MMNMNSFGMNGFGMNGCNFFTNCDGTMNTKAMLGYGLTNMGLNLGMSIFNCYWGGGAGGSSKAKKEDPVKSIDKDINAQLDKLKKGLTEDELESYKPEDDAKWKKLDDAVTTAEDKKSTATKDLKTYGDTTVTIGTGEKKETKKISELTETEGNALTGTDKRFYNQYKELKTDLEAGGKYDQAIEKAKTNRTERENEIQRIKDKIKALQTKREEVEQKIEENNDDKTLDDADGYSWQQTNEDDFNKKYKNCDLNNQVQGTQISINKDDKGNDQKVSKNDLRGLIARYRGTMDSDKKKLYANQFQQLWELAEPSIQSDSSLRAAYNIMHDDMVEIGKKKEPDKKS